MINTFSRRNFRKLCDALCKQDKQLKAVVDQYGYPPMWTRKNTFESLVHIILEQQVSLASALAALNKLHERLDDNITPERFLALTDDELKRCYFSRQKTLYTRGLAEAIATGSLNLRRMTRLDDDTVRKQIVALKGLGNWSADIYLMFVLQRADLFPIGDLAARKAMIALKKLDDESSHENLIKHAAQWKPYRSVATMILWHYYLSSRMKKKTWKR